LALLLCHLGQELMAYPLHQLFHHHLVVNAGGTGSAR
jgi:hypothetical protein